MKLTFITNYLTHHQLPFTEEMYRRLGSDFVFIATNHMDEERVRMGWAIEDQKRYPYIRFYDDDMQSCGELIMDCDVLICGGTHELYIRQRVEAGRITLRYFERLYKKGQWRAFTPRGYIKKWKEHTAQRKKPIYLLCAGAYVASDFHLFRAYSGKMLKWGYFPPFIPYDLWELMEGKKGRCDILWSGRMIDWKHAEDAVEALKILLETSDTDIEIHLTMIGEGECASRIKGMIESEVIAGKKLSDAVTLQPFMRPEEVRSIMEKSDIYLMTSDYEEGWGAVVNEAMNGGCAVIASSGAGSVPYLIRHGENGMVYRSGDVKELAGYLGRLANDAAMRKKLGIAAYKTIAGQWSPGEAAERMVRFCKLLVQGDYRPEAEGPLSPAELIGPRKGYEYCHKDGRESRG